MKPQKEVGSAQKIDTAETRFVVHIPGNPAEQARLVKRLLDEGHSQGEVAKMLRTTQPQVHRLLRLLDLDDVLFGLVLQGKIGAYKAYLLARLPKEEQRELLRAGEDGLKEEAIAQRVRDKTIATAEVLEAASEAIPLKPCPACGGTGKVTADG